MPHACSGPEIQDSPDKEKRASIEGLISDVSGLSPTDTYNPDCPPAKEVTSTDSKKQTCSGELI